MSPIKQKAPRFLLFFYFFQKKLNNFELKLFIKASIKYEIGLNVE